MKNNNKDITIKSLWKSFRSSKGRKISFLIFYICFFIFLFIYMAPTKKINNENEIKEIFPFKINNIEEKSYNFTYIINKNNELLEFLGIKELNAITLKDDRGEYSFIYQNGSLTRTDNNNLNIPYNKLLDIYEIKRIIKNSKLISETKLNETNEYIYKYEIKNKDLSDIFNNNIETDEVNEINIRTNSKKELKEIVFDFINYEKISDKDIEKFIITINYGETDE